MALNAPLGRKLRMGLIGGGQGAFIGRVHALAATLDNRAEVVAGALSSDPDKAKDSAPAYGIAQERAYASYQALIHEEAQRTPEEQLDFVTIATPNDTHAAIAQALVQAGFHVVCDKPMTTKLADAEQLAALVHRSGTLFAVMHNYTGYPLVRQAREMIRAGELGEVQALRVHYLQGSLRRHRTPEQQKRFAWKNDPQRAGPSGCFGDIGIHAYHLARFATGLAPERVSCTLATFHPEGKLDDYGTAAIQFAGGALGLVTASRISHGRENGLRLEVDGTRASLEWQQEEPNKLWVRVNGQPQQLYTCDSKGAYLTRPARAACRLSAGHPEGFLSAFANIYAGFFTDLIRHQMGAPRQLGETAYPDVIDGVDGVHFVAQCVASAAAAGAWRPLALPGKLDTLAAGLG
jgi:predicted dehydrogenase